MRLTIASGATALERCGARLSQAGGSALEEPRRLEALLAFFRVFLDRWHHAKEEEVLVPSLLAAGAAAAQEPVRIGLAAIAREKRCL